MTITARTFRQVLCIRGLWADLDATPQSLRKWRDSKNQISSSAPKLVAEQGLLPDLINVTKESLLTFHQRLVSRLFLTSLEKSPEINGATVKPSYPMLSLVFHKITMHHRSGDLRILAYPAIDVLFFVVSLHNNGGKVFDSNRTKHRAVSHRSLLTSLRTRLGPLARFHGLKEEVTARLRLVVSPLEPTKIDPARHVAIMQGQYRRTYASLMYYQH